MMRHGLLESGDEPLIGRGLPPTVRERGLRPGPASGITALFSFAAMECLAQSFGTAKTAKQAYISKTPASPNLFVVRGGDFATTSRESSELTMSRILTILVVLLVILLGGAAVLLSFIDVPVPVNSIEKVIPDDRLPH